MATEDLLVELIKSTKSEVLAKVEGLQSTVDKLVKDVGALNSDKQRRDGAMWVIVGLAGVLSFVFGKVLESVIKLIP